MGKRGPSRKLNVESVQVGKPWEAPGLSRAERVISFIETLPITSGKFAGTNMILREWQKDIVHKLFAVDEDGKRIVRQCIVTMPRKSGKTFLLAALAMCFLVGPEAESRGQIYSCAVDQSQSSLLFSEMEAMILRIDEFKERINIKSFHKRMEDSETGTLYRAMAATPAGAHGLSPSLVVYDEAAQSRDAQLWENMISGMGAREEPLAVVISTMPADELHWMYQLVTYGRKIRAGELPADPKFLLIDYSADLEDDPWDEKTWFRVNPALGDFRSLPEMREFAERARKVPSLERVFRSLYLNMPVSLEERFISKEDWDACAGDAELIGPCYGGLDLGAVSDLTGLALFWPETGAVRCWAWMPGDPPLWQRAETDRVPWDEWQRAGLVQAFDGRSTDRAAVALTLCDLVGRFDVVGIGYDRWRIEELMILIRNEGGEVPLIPFGQGFRDMGPACDALLTATLEGKIRHGDHAILRWNMANVKISTDPAGSRKMNKARSQGKIDLAVCLAMAVGLSARVEQKAPVEFDEQSIMIL